MFWRLLIVASLLSCAAESSFDAEKSTDWTSVAPEFDTGGAEAGGGLDNEPLPDSLKGDSVMHIEIDPSDYEEQPPDSATPDTDNTFESGQLDLEISDFDSEESLAESAFVVYFEGDKLWVEHRGANASCRSEE